MQNLFGLEGSDATGHGHMADRVNDESDSDFMQLLFGSPRDGSTTSRGGPAFTPRGTLVALSEASGNNTAAIALGKPLQKQSGVAEETHIDDAAVNMDYAKEWVQKIMKDSRLSHASVAVSKAGIRKKIVKLINKLDSDAACFVHQVKAAADEAVEKAAAGKKAAAEAESSKGVIFSMRTAAEKYRLSILVSASYVAIWAFFYLTHDGGEVSE